MFGTHHVCSLYLFQSLKCRCSCEAKTWPSTDEILEVIIEWPSAFILKMKHICFTERSKYDIHTISKQCWTSSRWPFRLSLTYGRSNRNAYNSRNYTHCSYHAHSLYCWSLFISSSGIHSLSIIQRVRNLIRYVSSSIVLHGGTTAQLT